MASGTMVHSDDAQVLRLVFVIVSQTGFEGVDEVGRILAQADHVGLAKDKGRLLVRDDGRGFAREADIFGPTCLSSK